MAATRRVSSDSVRPLGLASLMSITTPAVLTSPAIAADTLASRAGGSGPFREADTAQLFGRERADEPIPRAPPERSRLRIRQQLVEIDRQSRIDGWRREHPPSCRLLSSVQERCWAHARGPAQRLPLVGPALPDQRPPPGSRARPPLSRSGWRAPARRRWRRDGSSSSAATPWPSEPGRRRSPSRPRPTR